MSARTPFRHARPVRPLALACLLALALAPAQAHAAQQAQPDCKPLHALYLLCYETGLNADSSLTCLSACEGHMARTIQTLGGQQTHKKKGPNAAQAMTELVCSTGCEDGIAQVRATVQEFTEAFCE